MMHLFNQYKTKLQLCAFSFLIKEFFRDYGQVHINSISRSLGLLYGASFPIAAKACRVQQNKKKKKRSHNHKAILILIQRPKSSAAVLKLAQCAHLAYCLRTKYYDGFINTPYYFRNNEFLVKQFCGYTIGYISVKTDIYDQHRRPSAGWPTIQMLRATFLSVLQQRAISYTRNNDRITKPHIDTHTLA